MEEGAILEFEDRELHVKTEQPMVSDSATEQSLTDSFSALYNLAALLGQALGVLSRESAGLGHRGMVTSTDEVEICSKRLDQWFGEAKASFPNDSSVDKSVILQNHVTYIYYQEVAFSRIVDNNHFKF